MKLGKILIYGSSHFSQVVCEHLLKYDYCELVGFVPSHKPTIIGNMPVKEVEETVPHDIKLSLQYNKKMSNIENAYNVHTGLLPEYGGRDIMAHTILNKEVEQGLTFHKMTEKYDYGPIISKITYPVFEDDTVLCLYKRQMNIAPSFVLSSLMLLQSLKQQQVNLCPKASPTMYRRTHDIPNNFMKYKMELENEYS